MIGFYDFPRGGAGTAAGDGPAAPACPSVGAAAANPTKLRRCLDCGAELVYPDGFASPLCCWTCEWDRELELTGPPMIGVLLLLLCLAAALAGAAAMWLAVR